MSSQTIYLRFGTIPGNGKSECHTLTLGQGGNLAWESMDDEQRAEFEAVGYTEMDGTVYEPGLSVFALECDADSDADELTFDLAACLLCDLGDYSDRPAFLLKGDALENTGCCGEPLLLSPEIVGSVEIVEILNSSIRVRRIA